MAEPNYPKYKQQKLECQTSCFPLCPPQDQILSSPLFGALVVILLD